MILELEVESVTKKLSSASTTEYVKGNETGTFILCVKFFGLILQKAIPDKNISHKYFFTLSPQQPRFRHEYLNKYQISSPRNH